MDITAVLSGGTTDGVAYTLTQVDIDHVMQFLWLVSLAQVFQFVMLVLISGLIFGLILTRKWHA